MPQLHLPPVVQAISVTLGVALAITRLLTASKAFWWLFPEWLQKGLPALLVAAGVLPQALEHAQTWLDVAQALMLSVGAWFTASRGDKRPVEQKGPPAAGDAQPVAAKPNEVFPQTMAGEPIEMRGLQSWHIAPAGLVLVSGALLLLLACDPRKPPCDEAKLRAIDLDYEAKVVAECLPKYDRKEDCPRFSELQAEHRANLRKACPQ